MLAGVIGAALAWNAGLQAKSPANINAVNERWEWDGQAIGEMWQRAFADEDPLLAVNAAGTLPYFSKFRSLDMAGLTDRHIAMQPPSPGGFLGHDYGDGKYVLDRQPDLVVFAGARGGGPAYKSGGEMARDERFKSGYQMVRFEAHDPKRAINDAWIRLDGSLGVRSTPDRIEYPAYALVAERGTDPAAGGLTGEGGSGALLVAASKLHTRAVELPPGTWTVRLDPPNPRLDVSVRNVGKLTVAVDGGAETRVSGTAGANIEVHIESKHLDTMLGRILFERVVASVASKPLEPKGETVVQVGALASGVGADKLAVGDFSNGAPGWSFSGRAFQQNPAPGKFGNQGRIQGAIGALANSYHPETGDAGQGTATSAPFIPAAGAWLELRVGGGSYGVGVRLRRGEEIVMSWCGEDSETLRRVRYDLSGYAGQKLHIEIFDERDGSWGHVLADEIFVYGSVAAPGA